MDAASNLLPGDKVYHVDRPGKGGTIVRDIDPGISARVHWDTANIIQSELVSNLRKYVDRYHYEEYSDQYGPTSYDRRVQWLVFDRLGVGCMCSVDTKEKASLIVWALNAYKAEV